MALRTRPRHALRFELAPYNLQERAKLVARLRQAAKSGLVAVPFWGRGLMLASAPAQASTVTLAASPAWRFLEDDPLFFCSPHADACDAWEVRTVLGADGATLTLDAPLTRAYPAGWFCWPVLLGHATHGDIEVPTDWHLGLQIDFQQLAAPPDPPRFENICFEEVPGSCETFNFYPNGKHFTGADPEILLLAPGLTVPCWLSLCRCRSRNPGIPMDVRSVRLMSDAAQTLTELRMRFPGGLAAAQRNGRRGPVLAEADPALDLSIERSIS
jgi:hypothetical protein